MLIILALILLLIYIKRKKGQIFPPFLILALIFSELSIIIYIFYYLAPTGNEILKIDLYYLSTVLLIIAFFYIYLHYESLISERHIFFRFLLIFGMLVFCLTLHLIVFLDLYNNLNSIDFLINFITTIYSFIIITFSIKVIYDTYAIIKEKAIIYEFIILLLIEIACILYLLGVLFIYTDNLVLNDIGTQIYQIGNIAIISCLVLLAINYIIHRDYVFRIPFPINRIMMINNSGLIVYNRQTASKLTPELSNTMELLLGGYINAVSHIAEEILGSNFQFHSIESGEFKINFFQIKKKKGILVIISTGGNYLLQKSIDHFMKSLPDKFLERIQSPHRLKDAEIQEIDSFLQNSFPYLQLLE